MNYNILYEPWLLVRYIDGTTKRIGVRQAFVDAKNIREVLPPVMYGNKQFFVAFTNLHLLAVIAMAANYKPGNKFAAKRQDVWDDQLHDGMDIQTILDYLDTYEDRFNIFSETHPFLQNIKYRNEVVNQDMLTKSKITGADIQFISNCNIFAPSSNNPMVGQRRTYTSGHNYPIPMMHYQMTPSDFVHILIASPWSPGPSVGQYPGNLYGQANIVISPVGKTLEETILRHCVSLQHSTRPSIEEPDALYDRPRWEWDNEEECFLHPRSDMLSNAFFNGIEMLASPRLNADGYIAYVYMAKTVDCMHPTLKKAKKSIFPPFYREKEYSEALCYNPYVITSVGAFEDQSVKFIASEYTLSKTAPALFVSATKRLNVTHKAHILDYNQDAPAIRLYYRAYTDSKRTTLDNQGVLEMPAVALELLNSDKHAAATLFQEKYSKILKPFAKSLRMIDMSKTNVTCRVRELSHLAKDVFLQMIEVFKVSDASEYEHVIQEYVAQIKQEARRILENEGRVCHSAVKYNKAWDHLLKNIHKL